MFYAYWYFLRGNACFKEWGGGGGGGGVLTRASGYNFPLFLVYPVDMPDKCETYKCSHCLHKHWIVWCQTLPVSGEWTAWKQAAPSTTARTHQLRQTCPEYRQTGIDLAIPWPLVWFCTVCLYPEKCAVVPCCCHCNARNGARLGTGFETWFVKTMVCTKGASLTKKMR